MLKIRISGKDEEIKAVNDFLNDIGLEFCELRRYPNRDNKTFRIYAGYTLEELKQAIQRLKE